MQAAQSVQVENRLQDGIVRIDGEAIDTKAMSANRGLGIFKNWKDNISNYKPKLLSNSIYPRPVYSAVGLSSGMP